MESLIHADIFFFMSTISVILLTAGIIVIIVYLVKILRNMRDVSEQIKNESGHIIEDIALMRASMKQEGFRFARAIEFFKNIFKKKSSKKK